MFLFEYLIKLLMGNTSTLFLGLIIVLFGYYGWLLYNINKNIEGDFDKWDKTSDKLNEILHRLDKFDELYYKELTDKIIDNKNIIKEIDAFLNNNLDLEKIEERIVSEIKEESGEIKERMNILVGRRRSNTNNSKEDT